MSIVSPAVAPAPGAARSIRLSRLSDELLARHAARGSERAFTVLYERYHQPLYRYCRSIVRDDVDAQDALQSTFTGALAALKRDGRSAPLRPWLYRIAHNESISVLRRRKREAQHEVADESAAVGISAEDEAAGRARWRRLVDDLAGLPERQRGALLLRELAGLSHEDIALALGLTVGAAKQAIFEARQGLAELEEGRAMSCEEVRQRLSEGDRRVLRGRRVRSHLRECALCETFALAIPARQAELRAMAPALPPAAAAALLGRVISSAAPHGGASAAAGSAATAGVFGKAGGTVLAWKAVAGAAILATTAAGVSGLSHVLAHSQGAAPTVLSTKADADSSPAPHGIAASAAGRERAALGGANAAATARTTHNSRHGADIVGSASAGATHRHPRHSVPVERAAGRSNSLKVKGRSSSRSGSAAPAHTRPTASSGSQRSTHTHTRTVGSSTSSRSTTPAHRPPRVAINTQLQAPSNVVSSVTGSTPHASAGNALAQPPASAGQ